VPRSGQPREAPDVPPLGTMGDVRTTTATAPVEMPTELDQPVGEEQVLPDLPWVTVVWNDPVNLMSYVTYVFRTYFGYDKKKAEKLMLEVHHDGKSAVSNGSREEMERDVQAMHEYGLWATLEKQ
jgi:ATP-dependent Clp protease adaptor protein ClpS